MNDSLKMYEQTIKTNYDLVCNRLKGLFNIVGKLEDPNKRESLNILVKEILSTCKTLQSLIQNTHRPGWINAVFDICKQYQTKEFHQQYFQDLINIYPQVVGHRWKFKTEADGINFDAIYQKYKAASELPNLWNELIKLLEKLIAECGDDLQSKTLTDLERLLSTVKLNSKASYSAIQQTLLIIYQFFKNAFFTLFPYIKISAEAYKTVKDIRELINDIHEKNEMVAEKVNTESVGLLRNEFTYSGQGILNIGNMIPEKVTSHYVDQKV